MKRSRITVMFVCLLCWVGRSERVRADDCNLNGTADEADIAGGTSTDCDADGTPDECIYGVGLLGSYYRNMNLFGIPITRTDSAIDFVWDGSVRAE